MRKHRADSVRIGNHAGRQLLGVSSIAKGELRAKTPAFEQQGNRHCWAEVKSTEQRCGAETRLTARKPFCGKIEAAMKWRTPKLPVNAGSLQSGCVQNSDYIVSIGAALEILVSPGGGVQEEPAGGIRQKSFGLYFRVDDLGEHITEDQPKNI